VRQLQQMKELGAKSSKSLPVEMLDRAAVESLTSPADDASLAAASD